MLYKYLSNCINEEWQEKICMITIFFLDILNPQLVCIHTDGDTSKAKNIRPISMVVCISEILPGKTCPQVTMLPPRALTPQVKSICEINFPYFNSTNFIFILYQPTVHLDPVEGQQPP